MSLLKQNTIPDRAITAPVSQQPVSAIELTELQYKVKLPEVCVTTRQLATLLQAGMNLVPALSALIEQLHHQPLGQIITIVRDDVNAGSNLADALRKHPRIFSNLYTSMVKAGQTSGTLDKVLLRLAEMLEKQTQLKNQLASAMIYPVAMAILAVAVVMFLMAFVIPSIAQIFLDINRDLPLITTILINLSRFIQINIWFILIAAIAMIVGLKFILTRNSCQRKWHQWKLQLPIIGDFALKIEATRFCRTLSTLLSSGIPILTALNIVKDIVQNKYIIEKLNTARQEIGDGATIARSLKRTRLFAPIMTHTIAVGELSGQLEQGLTSIANTYDEEIDLKTKSLMSLIEPAIAVSMGLIVGLIVLAILLPIFEINQNI
jgi:general secretion pathway protein F